MVNTMNALSNIARLTIQHSESTLQIKTKELSTGQTDASNIGFRVIGAKLQKNAQILDDVSKGITYANRLLHVGQSALSTVLTNLETMRTIVSQANTATGSTLTELNNVYIEHANEINRILADTNFDNRSIFTSLVSANGGPATEGIGANSTALSLRVGEDIADTISIVVPKLTAGDGTVVDAPVDGRFEPILGTIQSQLDATASVTTITGTNGQADVATATASYAAIVLPGNYAGDLVVQAAKDAAAAAAALGAATVASVDKAANDAAAAEAAKHTAAGDILTSANRTSADAILISSISNATKHIGLLNSKMQNLEALYDENLSASESQRTVASQYLDTQYEIAATEFKSALAKIQTAIAVVAKGDQLSQSVLQLITA